MSEGSPETARANAITRLEAKAREANAKASDRYWQNGPHNVQRWVERGYLSAIAMVKQTPPAAGESSDSYLSRVSSLVRATRDDGPDDDDEGWYSGAIDDAASVVTSG